MMENSRHEEAFREYPAGARIQWRHVEYLPEQLSERMISSKRSRFD